MSIQKNQPGSSNSNKPNDLKINPPAYQAVTGGIKAGGGALSVTSTRTVDALIKASTGNTQGAVKSLSLNVASDTLEKSVKSQIDNIIPGKAGIIGSAAKGAGAKVIIDGAKNSGTSTSISSFVGTTTGDYIKAGSKAVAQNTESSAISSVANFTANNSHILTNSLAAGVVQGIKTGDYKSAAASTGINIAAGSTAKVVTKSVLKTETGVKLVEKAGVIGTGEIASKVIPVAGVAYGLNEIRNGKTTNGVVDIGLSVAKPVIVAVGAEAAVTVAVPVVAAGISYYLYRDTIKDERIFLESSELNKKGQTLLASKTGLNQLKLSNSQFGSITEMLAKASTNTLEEMYDKFTQKNKNLGVSEIDKAWEKYLWEKTSAGSLNGRLLDDLEALDYSRKFYGENDSRYRANLTAFLKDHPNLVDTFKGGDFDVALIGIQKDISAQVVNNVKDETKITSTTVTAEKDGTSLYAQFDRKNIKLSKNPNFSNNERAKLKTDLVTFYSRESNQSLEESSRLKASGLDSGEIEAVKKYTPNGFSKSSEFMQGDTLKRSIDGMSDSELASRASVGKFNSLTEKEQDKVLENLKVNQDFKKNDLKSYQAIHTSDNSLLSDAITAQVKSGEVQMSLPDSSNTLAYQKQISELADKFNNDNNNFTVMPDVKFDNQGRVVHNNAADLLTTTYATKDQNNKLVNDNKYAPEYISSILKARGGITDDSAIGVNNLLNDDVMKLLQEISNETAKENGYNGVVFDANNNGTYEETRKDLGVVKDQIVQATVSGGWSNDANSDLSSLPVTPSSSTSNGNSNVDVGLGI